MTVQSDDSKGLMGELRGIISDNTVVSYEKIQEPMVQNSTKLSTEQISLSGLVVHDDETILDDHVEMTLTAHTTSYESDFSTSDATSHLFDDFDSDDGSLI